MCNNLTTVDESHIPSLMAALEPVYDWYNLGEILEVNRETLKNIKETHGESVEDCKKKMLTAWLKKSKEDLSHTKQDLVFTSRVSNINFIASSINFNYILLYTNSQLIQL